MIHALPRLLGLAFVGFLLLLSLDGGDAGGTALLMHQLPALLGAVALAIGWRWPLIGALAFDAMGFAYLVAAWSRFPLATLLAVAGPMFVIAGLFFVSHQKRHAHPS